MKKIYLAVLILLATITLFSGTTMAREVVITSGDTIGNDGIIVYDKGSSYDGDLSFNTDVEMVKTKSGLSFTMDSKTSSMASTIFGVVQYICLGAIFIVLLIKGVQFMNAAPEGKAEIKKQIIAIAIGAFIVFSIRAILSIISKLNLFG